MGSTVGELIAKRRKELGLSVGELAEKLGKSRATVYRYETGAIENLPAAVLVPLAKALNTSPDELMGLNRESEETLKREERILLKKYTELPAEDRANVRALVDKLHQKVEKTWQPQMTARDLRKVDKDFEAMKMASASFYDEVKDPEVFAAAIKTAMLDAKLQAKKLYTPKKYRK